MRLSEFLFEQNPHEPVEKIIPMIPMLLLLLMLIDSSFPYFQLSSKLAIAVP